MTAKRSTALRIAASDDIFPRPRRVKLLPGVCRVSPGTPIQIERGRAPGGPQSYSLTIAKDAVTLLAEAPAGVRHGLATLQQLLAVGDRVRCMRIEDWPDFAVRGVMIDISRDKVPTMGTLTAMIDRLASWKINQVQLYTEHTFAYVGHEVVWRDASPMTPREIERLDQYCLARGVELVPNQNCFGHMERWLKHAPYRDLAETQDGWKSPWGDIRTQAMTLNPLDPRSLRLVRDLLGQLLPHFSSRQVNVGCDETFELGQGRSAAACKRRGVGRVYLDFLLKIHRLCRRSGHRMQFWADIVQQHPELVASLPDDVIPMVWGYEADSPFDDVCRRIARRGLEFYVCPGTSSWCSYTGRTANCLGNLRLAARVGREYGATGYLVTDWGDYGHHQYLPASYLGFAQGAAVAWCGESNSDADAPAQAGRFAFDDPTGESGRLWADAGRIHEPLKIPLHNKTALFRVMQGKLDDPAATAGLSPARLNVVRRRLTKLRRRAQGHDWPGGEGQLVGGEFHNTLDILDHAVERAGFMLRERSGRSGRTSRGLSASQLAVHMTVIMDHHQALWRARNRPGGLRDSLARFEANRREYELI